MNVQDFRKHKQRTSFLDQCTPVLLGGVMLFSSACSQSRTWVGNPFSKKSPEAQETEIAGQSDASRKNLLSLMKGEEAASAAPTAVRDESEMSVQELMAAGKDPFLSMSSSQAEAPTVASSVETPASTTTAPALDEDPFRAFNRNGSVATVSNETPATQPPATNTHVPSPYYDDQVQLTSAEEPVTTPPPTAEPQVPVASPQMNHAVPFSGSGSAISYDLEPRTPLGDPFAHNHEPPVVPEFRVFQRPIFVGDEYIQNGVAPGTKGHFTQFGRDGLGNSETIMEWTDERGVARVATMNNVDIYAPKFAAVRSASLPTTGVKVDKLAGHQDQQRVAGMNTKLVIDEQVRNSEAIAMQMRSRSSGLEGKATNDALHQNIAAQRHVKLMNVYEDYHSFKEGQLGAINKEIIGEAIQAALDWNSDQGVVVYAHDQTGQEVLGRFTAQDYTAVEDRSRPGDLKVVKVVDKQAAKPGDILTFTIRFDNVGDRPLQNVRMVDNLSPRLVYVDGSVESNLEGKLDTKRNDKGHQVLLFSFDEQLKGQTGGWVTFQCQVR